jgi:hypothetical protein
MSQSVQVEKVTLGSLRTGWVVTTMPQKPEDQNFWIVVVKVTSEESGRLWFCGSTFMGLQTCRFSGTQFTVLSRVIPDFMS